MARAQRREVGPERLVLAFGQVHQAQQRIRHATAGGQDDPQGSGWQGGEDGSDTLEAVGVSDARPPELVHYPGSGFGHRMALESAEVAKNGLATLLTRPGARNDPVLARTQESPPPLSRAGVNRNVNPVLC